MSIHKAPSHASLPHQPLKRRKPNKQKESIAEDASVIVNDEFERLKTAYQSSISAVLFSSRGRGSGIGKFNIINEFYCKKKESENIEKEKIQSSWIMNALIELHDRVSNTIPDGVTWGEADGDVDPRRRCYGFLPGQRERLVSSGIEIQAEGSNDNEEHKFAMSYRASIDIMWEQTTSKKDSTGVQRQRAYENQENSRGDLIGTQEMLQALTDVTNYIQGLVSKQYKKYVTMDNLVAIQPNHHNGALFLPAHLDFPRMDGFGVVIATICIRKSNGSRVILIDDGDEGQEEKFWSLDLEDGDCYFLSGESRNKCLHGILSEKNGYRETLNLRYGLHSIEMAREEVDQHWPS
mmetsp:Transcript_18459/g.27890  ORF Transcript_18459/g.27890 Transcript_18459/m.27890 type:complete len:350 (-) Transcript_18459:345-1394(-)|eukprot:CAMPEP_0178926580 /NCGR_PEP_ID=MMETSP0786-20121207/18627_1 /TAXON_ID=186022 /ORGANISM="Thalassionema frauenfeldii, Strain CCMP 1798" /LENGTH=349 /DNA_ID=CAMNT_0020601749 /DNA_START=108 /DNA_END=1157 /DNA_ORIENTATION=-